MDFSERLKLVRKKRKLTQKQVANGIGITEQSYQRFEYGKVKPGMDIIISLSRFLDVPADYLLGIGLYKTLEKYPWLREPLNQIVDQYLKGYSVDGIQSYSVSEFSDEEFGEIASTIFAEIQVDDREEKKVVTIVPKIPRPENLSEGSADSD